MLLDTKLTNFRPLMRINPVHCIAKAKLFRLLSASKPTSRTEREGAMSGSLAWRRDSKAPMLLSFLHTLYPNSSLLLTGNYRDYESLLDLQ